MKGISVLRNLFHFSGVIIPLSYLAANKQFALILAAALFLVSAVVEFFRIKGRLQLKPLQRFIKEKEAGRPTGSFFFLLGALVTILLFERRAAVPALFILSISDPLSSLIGHRLGRTRLLGKSLEGTLAFFLSSVGILALFSFSAPVILICGLVATFTELMTPKFLDDNLSIPIVTAFAVTLLAG